MQGSRSLLATLMGTIFVVLLLVPSACGKDPSSFTTTNPGSNWWMYQTDLQRDGHYRGEGLTPPLEVAWQRDLGGTDPARYWVSYPVFGSGRVFAAHGLNPGTLHALSLTDGTTDWSFTAPPGAGMQDATLRDAVAVANQLVYAVYEVSTPGQPWTGRVYAFQEEDGAIFWQAVLPAPPYGPLAVVGGAVFVSTNGHTLYALDQATGTTLWTATTGTGPHTAFTCPRPRSSAFSAASPTSMPDVSCGRPAFPMAIYRNRPLCSRQSKEDVLIVSLSIQGAGGEGRSVPLTI